MADDYVEPARLAIGPPAPWLVTVLARLLELATLALTAFWVSVLFLMDFTSFRHPSIGFAEVSEADGSCVNMHQSYPGFSGRLILKLRYWLPGVQQSWGPWLHAESGTQRISQSPRPDFAEREY